jgi:hypothetical protein
MAGAAFGGLLLDHISIAATLIGGAGLLVFAALTVGNGNRIKATKDVEAQGKLSTPYSRSGKFLNKLDSKPIRKQANGHQKTPLDDHQWRVSAIGKWACRYRTPAHGR